MLLAVLGGGSVACGPSVRVDPLIGEEPELLQFVATTVPDLSSHAPTRAVHALYEALVREDMDAAWELLSTGTREALDGAAAVLAAGSGKALLVASAQTGVPLRGTGSEPVSVSPLTWLLAEQVSHYQLTLDPEEDPEERPDDSVVFLIDADQRYREIRLRREEDAWRIHQPTLRLVDVPGADRLQRTHTP